MAVWSALERVSYQACQLVVQLVLARLLMPQEFGIIAMVAVFVAVSATVIDAGLGRAIIQKKDISQQELSSTFFFNVLLGLTMTGALCLAAPLIARFFGYHELCGILRVLSLSLVFGSLGSVHAAVLGRNLRFKRLFWISFPSLLTAGAIGIALAYLGFGVWALVAQSLGLQVARSILLWIVSGWIPDRVFNWSHVKPMFRFGFRLALATILDQISQNLYVLVIGKIYTAGQVGFFHRARTFQAIPVTTAQMVLGSASFRILASFQHDPQRMRHIMSRTIQMACLFAFIAMTGMAAVAEPMVVTLIGWRWQPVVLLLQPLCIAGALYPILVQNLNLLMAMGRSELFFRIEIINKLIMASILVLTCRHGLQSIAYGMVAASVLSLFVNSHYTKKLIGYPLVTQLRSVLPTALLAIIMFAGVTLVLAAVTLGPLASLLLGIATGATICVLGLRFLNRELKDELAHVMAMLPYGCRVVRLLL